MKLVTFPSALQFIMHLQSLCSIVIQRRFLAKFHTKYPGLYRPLLRERRPQRGYLPSPNQSKIRRGKREEFLSPLQMLH